MLSSSDCPIPPVSASTDSRRTFINTQNYAQLGERLHSEQSELVNGVNHWRY